MRPLKIRLIIKKSNKVREINECNFKDNRLQEKEEFLLPFFCRIWMKT